MGISVRSWVGPALCALTATTASNIKTARARNESFFFGEEIVTVTSWLSSKMEGSCTSISDAMLKQKRNIGQTQAQNFVVVK